MNNYCFILIVGFMRRKNKKITNPNIFQDTLQTADTVRIAMIDSDKPYIVPLNYGYKNTALYIHCAKEGRKIDILKKIPVSVLRSKENPNSKPDLMHVTGP